MNQDIHGDVVQYLDTLKESVLVMFKSMQKVEVDPYKLFQIGVGDMKKFNNHTSLNSILLYAPILNADHLHAELALRLISSMKFKGKVVLYDLINETTEKWLRKLPATTNLLIDGVYNVNPNWFKIVWTKVHL